MIYMSEYKKNIGIDTIYLSTAHAFVSLERWTPKTISFYTVGPSDLKFILIHTVRILSKLIYGNLLIRCIFLVTSCKGRGYHLEDTFSVSPKSNAIKSVNDPYWVVYV